MDADLSNLNVIIEAHSEMVQAVAGHFLADPDDIDDTAQIPFCRLWEYVAHGGTVLSLPAWLACVSERVALDVIRRRKSNTILISACNGINDDGNPASHDPDNAEFESELSDLRTRLNRAIEQLPPRQKIAIICRYFDGLSVRDTATFMGCTEATVKTTIFFALKYLRRSFQTDTDTNL